MARAGASVVGLDAGPFWDPDTDWVSDEWGSHRLYWTEPRCHRWRTVPLGSNNSGRGVGGSMIHYAGYTPRFHPSDFRTATRDGVGADWPISYHDLRPYYEAIEQELPVSGQPWPWGDPHRYPYSPQPLGGTGRSSCAALVRSASNPHRPGGDRQRALRSSTALHLPRILPAGLQGQRQGFPLITHIPDALAHGAEIRANAMVSGWSSTRGSCQRGDLFSSMASSGFSGHAWSWWRATPSRRRACCCCPRSRAP